jgi:hypothetical protein
MSQFFKLDKAKLRDQVGLISSKCVGYAKILWTKENDSKKAMKNLFHALRFILFGIQIAEKGKIIDYKAGNKYYNEICAEKFTKWEEWKKWVKIGEMLYKFQKLVPKKIKSEKYKQRHSRKWRREKKVNKISNES